MDEHKKGLSVVIPSYNEEGAIGGVVKAVYNAMKKASIPYEVIIVDDGSTDKTAQAASAAQPSRLIRHPKNLGYGKAIVTGMDHSQYDLIAIMDADNTYDPDDIIRMLPLMESFDMVIGVRDMSNMKQPLYVKVLRAFLRFIIWYFTEHSSPDPNSGLRIFKKEMARKGQALFSLKFSFSTSLTLFMHLTNRFVEYLPIRYNVRIGVSKISHVMDSARTLVLITSMALIYKPLKFFAAHIILSVAGLVFLLGLKGFMSFQTWMILNAMWFTAMFFTAIAYIAFILSRIYASFQD